MGLDVKIKKKLKGFSLDVEFVHDGGTLGILGASGSGKTMILKSIAGLISPDEGHITVGGRAVFDSSSKMDLQPQKRNIGYFFQNYALFPHMTVWDNIAIAVDVKKRVEAHKEAGTEDEDGRTIEEIVSCLIGRYELTGLEKRYPAGLSGGQQQRVALARIFAGRPVMVLLDEPFSALDAYLRESMQEELLRACASYSGDVIIVTHNCEEANLICDDIVIISDGSVVTCGSTDDVFSDCNCKVIGRPGGKPSKSVETCFMRPSGHV